MNEQILKQIMDLIQSGAHFVGNQMPEAVSQFLANKAIDSMQYSVLAGVITLVLFFVAFLAIRDTNQVNKSRMEKDDDYSMAVFFIVIGVVFLFFTGHNVTSYYKIKVNPKGYLLEQVMNRLQR